MRILQFGSNNKVNIDFETFFCLFAKDLDKTARDLSLICAKMRKRGDDIKINLRFEINHVVPSGKKTRTVVKIVGVEEMIKNGGYYDEDTFETILDKIEDMQDNLYRMSEGFIQALNYARQEGSDAKWYAAAFDHFSEFIAAFNEIVTGYRFIEKFDPEVNRWIAGIDCVEAHKTFCETEGAIKL